MRFAADFTTVKSLRVRLVPYFDAGDGRSVGLSPSRQDRLPKPRLFPDIFRDLPVGGPPDFAGSLGLDVGDELLERNDA
jgi:hypothetical protein